MKLGVRTTPGAGFRELPTSVRIVLVDAHEHPGSTIGQIVARTGFPQSHVSAAVARLRDSGLLVTEADPADRRRTLVRPTHGRRVDPPRAIGDEDLVARVLQDELGAGAAGLDEVLAALDTLTRHLVHTERPSNDCTPGDPTC